MTTPAARDRNTPVPKPPRRLSDLIEMAIREARSLDRDIYEPNAGEWHLPSGQTCIVCLSGAIIARTLGEDHEREAVPEDYHEEEWTKALFALNEVREGEYGHALIFMGKKLPEPPEDFRWRYPQPRNQDFQTWEELDDHMASLEDALQVLRGNGY